MAVDIEIQEAVRVYLKVSAEGIYPIGCEERLRQRYGLASGRVSARLHAFLDPLLDVPDAWGSVDYVRAGELATARACALHPGLPAELCRAIGNYVAYLVWHG